AIRHSIRSHRSQLFQLISPPSRGSSITALWGRGVVARKEQTMSSVSITPFFTLTDGRTGLTFAGQGDRYRKNIAAIRLLRQLQRDARAPQELTDAERFTLAHYTAFGDSALLRRAFGNEARDLDGLVSADEAATIKRTSLTAFYTSMDVLQAKWAALTPILE